MVKLVSADGGEFELSLDAAMHSQLIRNTFNRGEDDEDDDDDDALAHSAATSPDGGSSSRNNNNNNSGSEGLLLLQQQPIELLRVGKRCLEKVVDFLKHYHDEPLHDIPTPLQGSTFEEVGVHYVCK